MPQATGATIKTSTVAQIRKVRVCKMDGSIVGVSLSVDEISSWRQSEAERKDIGSADPDDHAAGVASTRAQHRACGMSSPRTPQPRNNYPVRTPRIGPAEQRFS